MSTAVAEIDVQPPLPRNPLAEGFGRLSSGQKIRALGGVVVLLAIVIAAIFMGKHTAWRVLFANLNDKDGGAIVAQLATMNVPYKYPGVLLEPVPGTFASHPNKSDLITLIDLNAQERSDIVAFLKTLTDHDFITNPKFADPFAAAK